MEGFHLKEPVFGIELARHWYSTALSLGPLRRAIETVPWVVACASVSGSLIETGQRLLTYRPSDLIVLATRHLGVAQWSMNRVTAGLFRIVCVMVANVGASSKSNKSGQHDEILNSSHFEVRRYTSMGGLMVKQAPSKNVA